MKSKLIILAILVAASSVLTVAQQHRTKQEGNKDRKTVTPVQRAERISKELGLSEAEKAKVLDLFTKEEVKVANLREEVKGQQAAAKQLKAENATKVQEMRRVHDNEMEKIIGKEKFAKLQTVKNMNVQKMKNSYAKKEKNGQHKAVKAHKAEKVRKQMTPEIRANYMKTKLDLNDQQVAALAKVFKAQDLKNAELKKQKMHEMMTANDLEIEKIIGKDKMVKLKENRRQQIEKVSKIRKGRKA